MEINSLPPIPPYCIFFKDARQMVRDVPACFSPKIEDDSIFFMIEVTRIVDIVHDYIPWNWRIVIGSVAEVAWIEESEKLREIARALYDDNCDDHPNYSVPQSKEYEKALDAFKAASSNAQAWRIWRKAK